MSQAAETRRARELVTLGALFIGFLKVSLCGFGGGLVWARRIVVEQQQWIIAGNHLFTRSRPEADPRGR